MATKDYSNRQEKMVADFLGWEVVPASGARAFVPGDVRSADWLGECKTHAGRVETIRVMLDVWKKISEEAKSIFKQPAYFVDNGTQKSEHTWVIFDYHKACEGKAITDKCSIAKKVNAIFYHYDMLIELSTLQRRDTSKPAVLLFDMGDQELGITSLYNFHDLTR